MKTSVLHIGFFFSLFISIQGQTTYIHDDFEGNGNITTWHGDNCEINTQYTNPHSQNINTSATVLRYQDTGGLYANVRFDVTQNFDLTDYHVFYLKIYVSSSEITGMQSNQVSLKLQNGTLSEPWSTQSEVIKPIVLDQWQEIYFDFKNDSYINLDANSAPPTERTDFNRVVIQVNGEGNNDFVLAYIDDLYNSTESPIENNFDQLVWSDEFNVSGGLDTSNWFHQTLLPTGNSWYNGEIQHYTNRIENSFVENGSLKIVAKKESYTDQGFTKQYTSARLNSKFAFQYGRVEVRAKLPSGIGTWPAIWMLGKNIDEDGAYWDNIGHGTTAWPACGEIDIMEHWGSNQNYVQSAIHTPSSYGGTVNLGGQPVSTASSEFHLYAMEWSEEAIVFSVDNEVHYTYNPAVKDENTWPFDAEQYLLLNIAILPDIDPSFTTGTMEIDYVRIYQEENLSLPDEDNQKGIVFQAYPNPVLQNINISVDRTIESKPITIDFYSLHGNKIKSFYKNSNNQLIPLNIASLPSGIYLVAISVEGHEEYFKIIKQ
jgi:beta-glucanase (GH16 family)